MLRIAYAQGGGTGGGGQTGNSGKKRIGGNVGKSTPKKKANAPQTIKGKRIGGNV